MPKLLRRSRLSIHLKVRCSSTRDGNGTWSLGSGGLEIKAAVWTYAASVEKQSDGSFVEHYVGMTGAGWQNLTFTGRYCK
jgi:hypothetical protein